MGKLSHVNKEGKANMVDVGHKPDMSRTATATGFIRLQAETLKLVENNRMKKGDVVTIAEIAGIQAAKETSRLIPLCHGLLLNKIDVKGSVEKKGIRMTGTVKCLGKTGVEMEALTAVNIALLTIYDMCKAVDKKMVMEDIYLVSKEKV